MDDFVAHHHPSFSKQAGEDMARLGEARFMEDIAKLSYGYAWAHPAEFAWLTVQRIRYLLLPSIEIVYWHPLIGPMLIFLLMASFALLHIAALVAAWCLDRALFFRGVALTVAPLAPYILTHVESRYIYVINFATIILIVLVVEGVFKTIPLRGFAKTELS